MNVSKAISRILRDPVRKPLPVILREVVSYCAKNSEGPQGYVNYMLYRKEAGDPGAFLGIGDAGKVHRHQRNTAIGQFFGNKVLFHHHFKRTGIQLPRLLGYNVGKRFSLSEGYRSIGSIREFRQLLEELVSESPIIIVKPALGAGGSNVVQISQKDLEAPELSTIHSKIIATSYVFQERVQQHPDLDAFYSGCVNTIRIMTCVQNDTPEVISAVIRFGANGRHIDNVAAGGLFVGIDLGTGRLVGPARQIFKTGGGIYGAHPDSGKLFSNFVIPFFPEVLRIAIECCNHIPYTLVGWDIAISNKGPLVIEGNDWPSLDLVQIAYGGYKSHPMVGRLLEEIHSSRNGR